MASLCQNVPFDNTTFPLIPTTASNLAPFNVSCHTSFGLDHLFEKQPIEDALPWYFSSMPHTDTLKDCIDICSAAHPLCNAVTWTPGSGDGNCRLKRVWDIVDMPKLLHNRTVHSAQLLQNTTYTWWPDSVPYDRNGSTFSVTNGQDRPMATNFTSLYTYDMKSCMDVCATYSNCVGVKHDFSMGWGASNCYLLDTVGTSTDHANNGISSAVRSVNSSQSKAWIAGVVVGTVISIAIIVGLCLWLRRRRRHHTLLQPEEPESYDASKHIMPEHLVYEVGRAGTVKSLFRHKTTTISSA